MSRFSYTLNTAEQKLAQYLATARHQYNRQHGVTNGRVGPQSDDETDLEGVAAEIAFCHIANCYPDTHLEHRPDFDCITRNGHKVDVKATKHRHGRLLAVPGKVSHPPDCYALMVGEFPSYTLAGIAPAGRLLREDSLMDLGYGNVYALDQQDLDHPDPWLEPLGF